jgi:hypothetical protein
MLDLDAIKAKLDDLGRWPYLRKAARQLLPDCLALVAEVERLRAEAEAARPTRRRRICRNPACARPFVPHDRRQSYCERRCGDAHRKWRQRHPGAA